MFLPAARGGVQGYRLVLVGIGVAALMFAAGAREFTFDCVFTAPADGNGASGSHQAGVCTTPAGATVSFRVDDEQGGAADGIRVFAGPRWDPFIMDAPAALETIATGKLAFNDPGAIFLDGKNVLSLVVEIDRAPMLHGAHLIGVVPVTLARDRLAVRRARAGRRLRLGRDRDSQQHVRSGWGARRWHAHRGTQDFGAGARAPARHRALHRRSDRDVL